MRDKTSILELFILTLLDRGVETKYELLRRGGISLGSSTPVILSLEKRKLLAQESGAERGKRPRHRIQISTTGRRVARTGWRLHLIPECDADLDSILRLVDMAHGAGASISNIETFLRAMAEKRHVMQQGPAFKYPNVAGSIHESQAEWRRWKLEAEEKFLHVLADQFSPAVVKSGGDEISK